MNLIAGKVFLHCQNIGSESAPVVSADEQESVQRGRSHAGRHKSKRVTTDGDAPDGADAD